MSQPSTLTAIKGLLDNNGLDNTFVDALFANLYNVTIINKAQTAITDVGGSIDGIGNDIFPGVVGNVPSAYTSVTPTSSLRTAYYNYARALFGAGDISRFTTYFLQAFGYAQLAHGLMADVANKNATNLSDYGANVKNQSDVSTGGITGFLTTSSAENLTKLGDDFVDLGTIFDYENLEIYGTARGLVKVILDAELNLSTTVQNLIDELGLDEDIDITDEVFEDLMLSILWKLPVSTEFREAFQFERNERLEYLGDILDPRKSLLRSNNIVTFESFTEIADSLITFKNLKIEDNIAFGKFIKNLSTTGPLANLDTITTPVSSDTAQSILDQIGEGNGAYGQPNVLDILGPLVGAYLEERVDRLVTALTIVQASSPGQSLIQGFENLSAVANDLGAGPYVVTGVGAGSYATKSEAYTAIETAMDTHFNSLRSFEAIGSLELRGACETVYADYDAIAKQVSDSKALLTKAGIDTSVSVSNKTTIMSFGNSIESFGADINNLGTREILDDMATSDTTGDAIKASLTAGKNDASLTAKGLIPKALSGY